MTLRTATPRKLLTCLCSPSEFLILSWVTSMMILGVIVILLIVVMSMFG